MIFGSTSYHNFTESFHLVGVDDEFRFKNTCDKVRSDVKSVQEVLISDF
jgi:hypothetical protein